MPRANPAPLLFLPYSHRENLPSDAVVHDVSSYAEPPYCTLSPMWAHGGIPVLGMPGKTSDSVEGIWQGLKVIRGKTAPHLFRGKGKKRGGKKPSGHQFGNKLLDYVQARYKIYLVAYEWMLDNRVDAALLDSFVERAFEGTPQYFHDLEDNGDINNIGEPLAHASLLVRYLQRRCRDRM